MKSDYGKSTSGPKKKYSGVYMQEGRVSLDADRNEQVEAGGHYVVFVHGIGEQLPGCYDEFGERIRQAFEKENQRRGKGKAEREPFVWEEAYWADITQPDQQELKKRLGISEQIRKFMVGSLGDVVAYSKLSYPPDKYGEIQERFASVIDKLSKQAEEASDTQASLDVIAHSLGTVIASDGIYDMIKTESMPSNLTLGSFFTMGSPIALFGLRYGLANFTKPIRPKTWINFLYPKDLIGFPLRSLNTAYETAVNEDVYLSPGGGYNCISTLIRRFLSMMPLAGAACHSWYFSDKRVVNRIAEVLAQQ